MARPQPLAARGTLDANGLPPTFWWFYDASTRAVYTSKGPLGIFGYGLRFLELRGLVSGGPASRFDEIRRLDGRFVVRLLFCRGCRPPTNASVSRSRLERIEPLNVFDQPIGLPVGDHDIEVGMNRRRLEPVP